ncbi:type II secretory ATPase GspE/PulE/Tfp pilus assembly ATPase PilB-like protein [Idiomarina fontislapidosi]|uniref:AAA+ ATPase domain-containing protein n=1 Tax=Idiomarina fontislapidosi TaxID=263723 RepID=A0A432YB80_9GAMM|nr:ATPase, T2SS/T4P/T4SS family [Idiomarina fontislapidosi]PYE35282.1 type II secretory ATPase GspE/PulE/Tfp pilus assembly ATPase PilB-like protein [Idiomarina fontislapidosi]RUO58171.1 hypothetical protein CWE25_00805 [Idiomarina fontislapidosi]|tara:strand:- start:1718 stop:3115 length:1398 start_codon:yes stop_codon:yes gene_type:complete
MDDMLQLDAKALYGCTIHPVIFQYCEKLLNQWHAEGCDDKAMLATESGLLVCSPKAFKHAALERENLAKLLRDYIQQPAQCALADAGVIRAAILTYRTGRPQAEQQDSVADQTHAQQLLSDLVAEGLAKGASDIHLRFSKYFCRTCFRVKGLLVDHHQRNREAMTEAIAAALNTRSHDYNEVFNEQSSDSASLLVPVRRDGSPVSELKVRLQKSPLSDGFAVTLRLLATEITSQLSLQSLGFESDIINGIDCMLAQRSGLILIVGPTGQGKTTTLAALHQRFSEAKKIISLEDPVELKQPNVEQRWIDSSKQENGFATAIKIALREDPDVISVSEIRDGLTAAAAIRAALTGHLVTATLHASDSLSALERLRDLGCGLEQLLTPGVLRGVIAQRLTFQRGQPSLIAEYIVIDQVARQFALSNDYQGWRAHLKRCGWRGLTERGVTHLLAETPREYHYSSTGPTAK